MIKLTTLFVFISSYCFAQNFEELYTETFKSDWEVYQNADYVKQYIDTTIVYQLSSGRTPEEELLFKAKENLQKRAARIAQIFSSLDINTQQLDYLVFLEQHSLSFDIESLIIKKGAVFTNDSVYEYMYDERSKTFDLQRYNYFENSKTEIEKLAKGVILNIIVSGKTNYLDSLEQTETDLFAGPLKGLRPQTQFTILIYNKAETFALRRIYLHETFAQLLSSE